MRLELKRKKKEINVLYTKRENNLQARFLFCISATYVQRPYKYKTHDDEFRVYETAIKVS